MTRTLPVPLLDEDGYLLQGEDGVFLLAEDDETAEPTRQPCPHCRGGCFVCGFTNWVVRD